MLKLWFNPEKNWFELFTEDGKQFPYLCEVKAIRDTFAEGTGSPGKMLAQFEAHVTFVVNKPELKP